MATHEQTRAGRAAQRRILVVEDEPDIRQILDIFLREKGFDAQTVESAPAALERLQQEPFDVILSDVRMPGMSGLDLLRRVKERDPEIELVLMTAYSSVADAVEAMRCGAADYIEKPLDFRRLEHILEGLFERRRLRQRTKILEQQLQGTVIFEGIVARCQEMLEIFSFIERLARYPTTALITGESGTGKELVARALHNLSPLRERPFVVCNCTALPPTLLESELFGHVRGAFTGADRDRKGLFEAAHGGTIFLDEIGELSLNVQAKLLRVLENREIKRIGSAEPVRIEIRIIAATNRHLHRMVESGTFREDLFYRLNVGTIHLPPLRERRQDIEPLARHFCERLNEKLGQQVRGFAPAVLDLFQRYPWPGNVRELANVIERAMILAGGTEIGLDNLPPYFGELGREGSEEQRGSDLSLEAAEREQIRKALEAAGGKRLEAARLLGLSRRTLYRKLDKYQLH